MTYSEEFIQAWITKSLIEQLANIGSEVHRAISWRERNNPKYSKLSFDRSIELIDFTLTSKLTQLQKNEILKLKECWSGFYLSNKNDKLTKEYWEEYFYKITYEYALRKGV